MGRFGNPSGKRAGVTPPWGEFNGDIEIAVAFGVALGTTSKQVRLLDNRL
ncbi:Uncharacterized protein pbN1_10810 [Aromatoleum bremense]|nr:Uncharacterized protein pbN1_10810 [Aromatoleum bremense]